ncbi:hypothetical protein COO60DRAFT_1462001 [Scenedesmus sp. NREL 46B-D3]|nr:hypothetical protein COO60DRAFT_1462001 [Scenedesmus sp. NREL 46B-D3]
MIPSDRRRMKALDTIRHLILVLLCDGASDLEMFSQLMMWSPHLPQGSTTRAGHLLSRRLAPLRSVLRWCKLLRRPFSMHMTLLHQERAAVALQRAADTRRLSGVFEEQQLASIRQLDRAEEQLSAVKAQRPGSSHSQRVTMQQRLQQAEQEVQHAAAAAQQASQQLELVVAEKEKVQLELQAIRQQLETAPMAKQQADLYNKLMHAGRLSHKYYSLSDDFGDLQRRYHHLASANEQLASQLKEAHEALFDLQAAVQATPPAKRQQQRWLMERVEGAEQAVMNLATEKSQLQQRLLQAQAFIACLQQRPASFALEPVSPILIAAAKAVSSCAGQQQQQHIQWTAARHELQDVHQEQLGLRQEILRAKSTLADIACGAGDAGAAPRQWMLQQQQAALAARALHGTPTGLSAVAMRCSAAADMQSAVRPGAEGRAAASAATTAADSSAQQLQLAATPLGSERVVSNMLVSGHARGLISPGEVVPAAALKHITPEWMRDIKRRCAETTEQVAELRQQLGLATPEAAGAAKATATDKTPGARGQPGAQRQHPEVTPQKVPASTCQQQSAASPFTPGAMLNAAAESRLLSPSTDLQHVFGEAQGGSNGSQDPEHAAGGAGRLLMLPLQLVLCKRGIGQRRELLPPTSTATATAPAASDGVASSAQQTGSEACVSSEAADPSLSGWAAAAASSAGHAGSLARHLLLRLRVKPAVEEAAAARSLLRRGRGQQMAGSLPAACSIADAPSSRMTSVAMQGAAAQAVLLRTMSSRRSLEKNRAWDARDISTQVTTPALQKQHSTTSSRTGSGPCNPGGTAAASIGGATDAAVKQVQQQGCQAGGGTCDVGASPVKRKDQLCCTLNGAHCSPVSSNSRRVLHKKRRAWKGCKGRRLCAAQQNHNSFAAEDTCNNAGLQQLLLLRDATNVLLAALAAALRELVVTTAAVCASCSRKLSHSSKLLLLNSL